MIADNLHTLLRNLPAGVTLVAVSKFNPVERLLEAYESGQRIFAESRPQELAAKVPRMPADVQWHFIGHLQTNKLKLVLPYVSLVQSVDSLHLLQAISDWGQANGKVVDILLELHLGGEETKQGFSEEEIVEIVGGKRRISQIPGHPRPDKGEGPVADAPRASRDGNTTIPQTIPSIRIRGLMGMATNTDDRAVVERDFERIERLYQRIQAMGIPDFDQLSIGMSGDWPLAVKHGATMVRIGTDIFGPREY